VLYDTVPGGTGYLRQLMRQASPMLEVLSLALEHLKACACNREPPPVDGCYRCLYVYRNSHDMPHVSREAARRVLAEILAAGDRLHRTDSLARVPANAAFDSELEARFVEALRQARWEESPVTVRPEPVGGPGYVVQVGGTGWQVRPQADLGPADGVTMPVRPDFLFQPLRRAAGVRPIAVFTDGFGHHWNRIGEDLAKRTALVRSGQYWVVSVTWRDVENRLRNMPPDFTNILKIGVNPDLDRGYFGLLGGFGLADYGRLHDETGFAWLLRLLARPDAAAWQKLAFVRLMLYGDVARFERLKARRAWADGLARHFPPEVGAEAEALTGDRVLGQVAWPGESRPRISLFAAMAHAAVGGADVEGGFLALLLDDAGQSGPEPDMQTCWNGVLRAFTLFQFLPRCTMTTTSWLSGGQYIHLPPAAAFRSAAPAAGAPEQREQSEEREEPVETGWEAIRADLDPALHPALDRLVAAGWPSPPDSPHELNNAKGAAIAQAELAWPAARVAALAGPDGAPDGAGRRAFLAAGWQAVSLDALPEPVPAWADLVQDLIDA
jgi:DEAD/DEAH box helicase domain-containing protein